ncbi:uncharacterized protein LOC101849379 [Aplysia californica]|uniref:Uncharacterized protein LOC101849379 n=1 Tax=Aplysia californica TaxID=6500 RepID=A0ABM1VUV8_APLCA|nr:uncharacterized protein LOC101849379 [Aplysia californica]XP_005100585.1 uncharacterized protein LOC101849379 [Aplysia californica]XP_035826200.1 uncharacterized protein LOC101849379 [Aplysia californica]
MERFFRKRVHQQPSSSEMSDCNSKKIKTCSVDGTHEVEEDCAELGGPLSSSSKCWKNPGHPQFIPVYEFSEHHVSSWMPDVEPQIANQIVKCVKVCADTVVRIGTRFISKQRPDTWANGNPYPFYKRRGQRICHSGSGYVEGVHGPYAGLDNAKLCKCGGKCPQGTAQEKKYWQIIIATARHVVYDDTEARECEVVFFDDRADGSGSMTVAGGWGVKDAHTEEDRCVVEVYTHDKVLAQRLVGCCLRRREERRNMLLGDFDIKLRKVFQSTNNNSLHPLLERGLSLLEKKLENERSQKLLRDKRLHQLPRDSRFRQLLCQGTFRQMLWSDGFRELVHNDKIRPLFWNDNFKPLSSRVPLTKILQIWIFHTAMRKDDISRQLLQDGRLRRLLQGDRSLQLVKDLCEATQKLMKVSPLFQDRVAIISHPHGRMKYITLGHLGPRVSPDRPDDHFIYTVPTCRGSSGGFVLPLAFWHLLSLATAHSSALSRNRGKSAGRFSSCF